MLTAARFDNTPSSLAAPTLLPPLDVANDVETGSTMLLFTKLADLTSVAAAASEEVLTTLLVNALVTDAEADCCCFCEEVGLVVSVGGALRYRRLQGNRLRLRRRRVASGARCSVLLQGLALAPAAHHLRFGVVPTLCRSRRVQRWAPIHFQQELTWMFAAGQRPCERRFLPACCAKASLRAG